VLDLSYLKDEQGKLFGAMLQKAQSLLRKTIKPQPSRIYTFSLAEACPHFHLHVIPRAENFPNTYKGRGIMNYPLEPTCSEEEKLALCKVLRDNWSSRFE
jgi:diadenosine tetraphosphate (Ap4A) HIT family hydrolase